MMGVLDNFLVEVAVLHFFLTTTDETINRFCVIRPEPIAGRSKVPPCEKKLSV